MTSQATLTVFAVPKSFGGHIGIIQRNAIRSWSLLPGVQILLLGNEQGTAEMAEEIGARHIPDIECNKYGTPYVASVFAIASSESRTDLVAYVNADIILMNDFIHAVERVSKHRRSFLLAGQRTNLDLQDPLAFDKNWEIDLRERAHQEGHLMGPAAIDYFVFRPDLFTNIPAFAIGRWAWDNWLLHEAIREGASLIDATPSIQIIHQNHDYAHVGDLKQPQRNGPEAKANFAIATDPMEWYDLCHATGILYPWGYLPAWSPTRILKRTRIWRRDHPRLIAPIRGVTRLWRAIKRANH